MRTVSDDKAIKFRVSCQRLIRTFISPMAIVSPTELSRTRYRSRGRLPRLKKLESASERFFRCRWNFSFHRPSWSTSSTTITRCSKTFAIALAWSFCHVPMPRRAMSIASFVDCTSLQLLEHISHIWHALSLSLSFRINQPGLAEATEYLIQAFYGFEAALIKVTCQTEVSEQYHVYLQTRQQSKDMCIAAIEQYTHTTIQFPTMLSASLVQDNLNTYGRRTSVTIIGSPAQVCQARKLFDVRSPCREARTTTDESLLAVFTHHFDIRNPDWQRTDSW